jgi:flagellar biosynthesis/type III secretory pathway protein FliH
VVTKEAEALQAAEAALAASEATRLASSAEAEETRRLLAAMRSELDEAREATRRFAMTLREDAERELVKLAMAVAARVVARELATAPELLVVWAREAIAGSPLGEQLELALSSDLSTTLTGADWGELAPFVARDPGLPSGTCEVRDGKRVITVDAATRLELVGEHLAAIAERDAA